MAAIAETVIIFFLMYAAVIALYPIAFSRRRIIDERFHELAIDIHADEHPGESEEERMGIARQLVRTVAMRLPKPHARAEHTAKLKKLLLQAGIQSADAQRAFHLIRLAMFVVGAGAAAIAAAMMKWPPAWITGAATVGAIWGVAAPGVYLAHQARIRQGEIGNQLADVLDLLVVSVEAGLGINEALKIVGTECDRQHEEIGHELAIVSAEMNAGATLGDALANLGRRTAVDDIAPLAATLVQSEQLGAKIGPALRASSDAMRSQRRLRAEEAAQKVSIKILFPLVLLTLPAMMMLIIGPAIIQALGTLKGAG